MACEQAMFEATDGVNTHKGGIFSLGLICFAAGRLRGLNRLVCAQSVCQQVAEICKGLVARELASRTHAATAGEKQYQQFGLTGARGEAELGFPTVRQHVLPYWYQEAGSGVFTMRYCV
jgi:triphosphoribosyl-dephospho-CoA synthase